MKIPAYTGVMELASRMLVARAIFLSFFFLCIFIDAFAAFLHRDSHVSDKLHRQLYNSEFCDSPLLFLLCKIPSWVNCSHFYVCRPHS